MGVLTSQPGKAVWTILAIALNTVRLPLWMIWYLPVALRGHRDWSWKQALRVQLVKTFLWNASMVELKTPLDLLPNAEKEKWAVIEPASPTVYTGPATVDPVVKPATIGGTWYPAPNPRAGPSNPDFVILHFHGGAYVIGDGRQQDAAFGAKTLRAHTKAPYVFAPQYRLSSNPGCSFPAQLQDAISAFAYLLRERDLRADQIILSGDSAGAHLTLTLMRYLTEHGPSVGLGLPHAALLWSPWPNPAGSLNPLALDQSPNKDSDYITAGLGAWGARTLHPNPHTGLDLHHPYIDFIEHPFATPIPTYISTGECEVLYHDDVKLAEEWERMGNKVQLQVEEHGVHDTILTGVLVGFEKEAGIAAERAGKWLESL